MNERLMNQKINSGDEAEINLRPSRISEYIGQEELKEKLIIYVNAAKKRDESLDHVLVFGPPGLGKTTLAHIIANEMESNIKITTGPSLVRPGDLAAILSTLEEGDVLFIDEIHRLPKVVEEILYSAMEDYVIDIITGKDALATAIRIPLPPFTLVGATTRFGDLSAPLRDRFGIVEQLKYYNLDELTTIIKRSSKILGFGIDEQAAYELARRSRGTPRIANRLFRRIRDFSQHREETIINLATTKYALDKLDIDKFGLDITDRKYLLTLINRYHGGPVGLDSLAATIGEETITLEDVNEPFLLQEGFIIRTSRGRKATEKSYRHLGIKQGEDNESK